MELTGYTNLSCRQVCTLIARFSFGCVISGPSYSEGVSPEKYKGYVTLKKCVAYKAQKKLWLFVGRGLAHRVDW